MPGLVDRNSMGDFWVDFAGFEGLTNVHRLCVSIASNENVKY